MKITTDDKKLLISVYSKPTDNHLYLDGNSCNLTKSIDRITTRVGKPLKQICSNDNDFFEQPKKYPAYLAAHNHKPNNIIRPFQKINKQKKS